MGFHTRILIAVSERNQRLTTNKSCIVNASKTTWENNNKTSWIILFSKFLNGYMWKLLELHDTMTQQLKSATKYCLKWENSNKPTQLTLLIATSILNTHSMAHSIVPNGSATAWHVKNSVFPVKNWLMTSCCLFYWTIRLI